MPTDVTDALPPPELVAAIPRLRRYARVLTGDATRADDLVQDTLARAWEKRRLWQAGPDLRAWLFTVMHNVYVNQLALVRRDAANVSLDADTSGLAWQLPVRGNQVDRVELLGGVGERGGRGQPGRPGRASRGGRGNGAAQFGSARGAAACRGRGDAL